MRFAGTTGVTHPRSVFFFYFQVRETNSFDAGDDSVWSQWLDTFLLRELLDVSRIRIPRCHHGDWNLQRGIYFRCVNNGTINMPGENKKYATPVSVMSFLPCYECSRAAEQILDAMLFTRVWNVNTRHA